MPVSTETDGITAASLEAFREELSSTVREEITKALEEERKTHLGEVAKLQETLDGLLERTFMNEDNLGVVVPVRSGCSSAEADLSTTLAVPASTIPGASTGSGVVNAALAARRLDNLAKAIADEAEARSALRALVDREVADAAKRLEELRVEWKQREENIDERLQAQKVALEKAVGQERDQRSSDFQELWAIMDSMWKQMSSRSAPIASNEMTATNSSKVRYFREASGGHREFTGDSEDIFTLYDLVREAISDSNRLSEEIAEERRLRNVSVGKAERAAERVELRLNTLQNVMRSATAGGSGGVPGPGPMDSVVMEQPPMLPRKPARTLVQLAGEDPEWKRLLEDPDHLFNGDDIIDDAYESYLKDLLPLMKQHNCSFKSAIELSAAANAAGGVKITMEALAMVDEGAPLLAPSPPGGSRAGSAGSPPSSPRGSQEDPVDEMPQPIDEAEILAASSSAVEHPSSGKNACER